MQLSICVSRCSQPKTAVPGAAADSGIRYGYSKSIRGEHQAQITVACLCSVVCEFESMGSEAGAWRGEGEAGEGRRGIDIRQGAEWITQPLDTGRAVVRG